MKNFRIDAHPHDYPSRELVESCICSVDKHFQFGDVVDAQAIAPGCLLLMLGIKSDSCLEWSLSEAEQTLVGIGVECIGSE